MVIARSQVATVCPASSLHISLENLVAKGTNSVFGLGTDADVKRLGVPSNCKPLRCLKLLGSDRV